MERMRKSDPETYFAIMKDIQVNPKGRIVPATMIAAISKVKKSLVKTKQLRKTEGLIFLDREELAGHMHSTRLWKKKRSQKFFDQEKEKYDKGKSSYSWAKHPRSKKWTIGIEKALEINKDNIIAASKGVEGKKSHGAKGMKKLGIPAAAGLNLSLKCASKKMLKLRGGGDDSDEEDNDDDADEGEESEDEEAADSGGDSDDSDDSGSSSGSGSDSSSSVKIQITKKARKDPPAGGITCLCSLLSVQQIMINDRIVFFVHREHHHSTFIIILKTS
jgi:hypothetical protein